MRFGDTSFQELLVHVPWWTVVLVIAVITVSFASIYFGLTTYSPMNGIQDASNGKISFWTCLYFSVVSESTLGDGNITPRGVSRAFVSVQVLIGLLVVGMVVAKIVGARSLVLARMADMTEGEWVDCVTSSDIGKTVLGRAWIRGDQTGLCFQGTDFHEDGTRAGSFISHSMAISKEKASFNFQSFDFTHKVFNTGQSTLRFCDIKKGRFTAYSITITDLSGLVFSGAGLRLDETPLQDGLKAHDDFPPERIQELREFFSQRSREKS